MSPGTEQLIRDYLTRLSGAARGRLDPVDRRALVHRTRDFIERKATLTRPETTVDFAKLLSELGEPSDLVDQEVRKLAALRDDRPPAPRPPARIARVLRHDSDGGSRRWPLQRATNGDGESNGNGHADEPPVDGSGPPDDRGDDTKARKLVGLVNLIPLHPNPQDHEARLFGRSRSHAPASPVTQPEDDPAEPEAAPAAADGALAADASPAPAPVEPPDSAPAGRSADAVQPDVDAAHVDSTSVTDAPPSAPASAVAAGPSIAAAGKPKTRTTAAAWTGLFSANAPVAQPAQTLDTSIPPAQPGAVASTPPAQPSALPPIAPAQPGAVVSVPPAQPGAVAPVPPARPGPIASLGKLRTGSVKAAERLITGTFKWCQRCPLEATASLVLGVGGALFPPVWLLGAALAFGSRLWDYRDRWLGLGAPLLLTIAGPAIAVSVLGGKYTLGHDVHLGWLYADILARVSAVFGTSYLVWRSVHGRRPPTVPPWNKPRRIS